MQDYFGQLTSSWQAGVPTEEAKFYSDLLYQESVTILDYFPSNSLLVVDDYQRIMETNREIEREAAEWQTQKSANCGCFLSRHFQQIYKNRAEGKVHHNLFLTLPKGMGNLRFQAIHNFQYRTMQQFFGQMPLLKTEMDRWRKQKQTVVIFIPTKDRIRKAEQMLRDEDILVVETEKMH